MRFQVLEDCHTLHGSAYPAILLVRRRSSFQVHVRGSRFAAEVPQGEFHFVNSTPHLNGYFLLERDAGPYETWDWNGWKCVEEPPSKSMTMTNG